MCSPNLRRMAAPAALLLPDEVTGYRHAARSVTRGYATKAPGARPIHAIAVVIYPDLVRCTVFVERGRWPDESERKGKRQPGAMDQPVERDQGRLARRNEHRHADELHDEPSVRRNGDALIADDSGARRVDGDGHRRLIGFRPRRDARRPRGIIAHCRWPLGTNLIEGMNNKIKVIKRTAYGYRDDTYFFLKIRGAFPGIR